MNAVSNRVHLVGRALAVSLSLMLLGLSATAAQASGEDAFSQTPLFLTESAPENVVFGFDDTSSLDFEVVFPRVPKGTVETDGRLEGLGRMIQGFTDTGLKIKSDLLEDVRYGYLFETGLNAGYNAQRINPDFDVVPPLRIYGFMRSAEYNPQYYDPAVQYRPWPYPVEGGFHTMPEADPHNPRLDPMFDLRFADTQKNSTFLGQVVSDFGNIINDFFRALLCLFSCPEPPPPFLELQYRPFAMAESLRARLFADIEVTQTVIVETLDGMEFAHITDGTACGLDAVADGIARYEGLFDLLDPDASALNTRPVCIANNPASYYYPVESGTYEWRDSSYTIQSGVCEPGGNDAARQDYVNFLEGFDEDSLKFTDTEGNAFPGTLSPEGVCLREVNLARSWEAGSDDINADVYQKFGRTFEEELQNFANWFTYHRRRHHSLRATIGESAVRMDNARGALMKSSEASAPEDLAMLDLSDRSAGGGLDQFLSQVYNAYNGATADHDSLPRTLLNSAGAQYQRQDAGAPVIYECQRNFTVLYSDGYSSEGNLSAVGNEDSGAGAPFSDSYSGTLGDIAWKYYQDLGLSGDTVGSAFPAGRVPTPTECRNADPDPSVDCNNNLHMNTFAVSPGRRGESVWGHPVAEGSELRYLLRSDAHANPPAWADVNASDTLETAVQRDDLYHGVVNGFGEVYGANDASGAAAGLRNAMSSAAISQFESITAVAISRDEAVTGTSLYSASFETGSWTGRLTARLLDPSARNGEGDEGGLEDAVLGDVEWEAGSLLDARNLVDSPRQIITSNDSGRGIPFRWNTSGEDALRTEAIADLQRGQGSTYGLARLEYLRGIDSHTEDFNFRQRESLLGDIVNSSPVYVGTPRQLWPDIGPFPTEEGKRYSDFKSLNRGRDPMVYVGANDGMLHGFSGAVGAEAVDGGQERLAYIPGFAFNSASSAGLSLLTDPNYNHRYYTDLTPSISDAYFQGHGDTPQWHTVLLGGMRTGGRGLFALDVTNPDPVNFSEDNAANLLLWEFTHADLGYLTEPMNVALVPWDGAHAWVTVFGNGYLPESGRAGLFMLRMDGGTDGTWTEGTDYRFIEVDSTAGDGLTSDARLVDLNGNGVTDRIYATGRDGRVWAFEPDAEGQWGSAFTEAEGSTVPAPLFTATDAEGNPQPITTGVMVARNPFVGSDEGDPNLLVFFGTGSYLSASDLTDFSTQSFYGIWDSGSKEMDRTDLQQHSIVTTSDEDGEFRNISDNAIDWDASGISGHRGWFFDFDDAGAPGERIVQMPRIQGKVLFFNTTIPEQNPCTAGGSGFRMFVSLDGSDPASAVFDANNDGVLSGDAIYSGFRHTDGLLSGGQLFGGLLLDNTTGIHVGRDEETRATLVEFENNQRRGRLGWQELIRSR